MQEGVFLEKKDKDFKPKVDPTTHPTSFKIIRHGTTKSLDELNIFNDENVLGWIET